MMAELNARERKDCWKLAVALQNVIERWEDRHPYIEIGGAALCKDGSVSCYIIKRDRKIKRKRGVLLYIPRLKKKPVMVI